MELGQRCEQWVWLQIQLRLGPFTHNSLGAPMQPSSLQAMDHTVTRCSTAWGEGPLVYRDVSYYWAVARV